MVGKNQFKTWLRSPLFWVVIFFVIRMYGITNPPMEVSHAWRQATTNMYARNFYEVDNNILYARVDHAGERTGITAKELPVFNYSIYLLSEATGGFEHWYGRLINLIVSSLGIYFFSRIVARYFNKEIALYSTIVLLVSIWFTYSRMIIPDTFSVSLVMIALYFGLQYLYEPPQKYAWIPFFIFGLLGVMSKVPALHGLCFLAIPVFDKKVKVTRKLTVIGLGLITFVLIYIWYVYWINYITSTYKYHQHYYVSMAEGGLQLLNNLGKVFARFYHSALYSYISFTGFLVGIYFILKEKNKKLGWIVSLSWFTFLIFIIKAGQTFYMHNYYVSPFVPTMALVIGFVLAKIPNKRWVAGILTLIVVEAVGGQYHVFQIRENREYKYLLEPIANEVSSPEDLIVINGGDDPNDLYFTHRKGWTYPDEKILEEGYLDTLRALGAKYLFYMEIEGHQAIDTLDYPLLLEKEQIKVFDLEKR